MTDESLLERVHALSDIELAILLCLVSREHCLISTPPDAVADLTRELQLVAKKTFGLQCVVIDCTPATTLEDFAAALLTPPHQNPTSRATSPLNTRSDYFVSRPSSHPRVPTLSPFASTASSQIANVVLARILDTAPQAVQIQALELLRTRRIFTRTSVQTVPKPFIFIPVLQAASGGEAHVTPHLNDFFYIAHWHDPEDGFENLEEEEEGEDCEDDAASTVSVVKRGHNEDKSRAGPLITEADISELAQLSQQVQVDIDVVRYQMNIISFLRLHRAVSEGITPTSTKHYSQLVRSLAPLHQLDYVTPALVRLAAKKVYLHRLRITLPEKERSMQWGSKLEAVQTLLSGVGPEDVVDDVLGMVTAPF